MPRTFSNTAAGGSCCRKILSIARNGRAAFARNPLLRMCRVLSGLHGKPHTYKSCRAFGRGHAERCR
eukprot:11199564-Lingulodinium_polyedra.AAC.1